MTDKENISESNFEDSIEESLKSLGYLFPSTEDELTTFERNNKLEEIPERYCSPIDILLKPKNHLPKINNTIDLNNSAENLSRAARKGGEIPDDIISKMKSDRKKSEDGEK